LEEAAMKRLLILALGIFLVSPLLAHAGAKTYTDMMGDHQWNTAMNWSPNGVPGPSDDVTIPSPRSATVTNAAASANTVTVASGGTLIIAGSLVISSSTSTFSGTLDLQAGVLAPLGDATVAGVLTSEGGSIIAGDPSHLPTVTINATTTISKSASLTSSGSCVNQGSITITGDSTQLTVGATFTNQAGASINITGDVKAGIVGNGGTINNSGTIAKTMGIGTSILSFTTLNNSGTVSAGTGTLLVLGGGGTETGAFNASGAVLEFDQGNLTLSTGTTFGGNGTVYLNGATWTQTGDVTVNTTTLQIDFGGTAGLNNLIINSTTVNWNGGSLNSSGGIGQVTLAAGSVMNIAATGSHTLGRNLDLLGTVNMSAELLLAATITVETGATFNIKADNNITGNGTINCSGTFEKTGGIILNSTLSFAGSFNTIGLSATVTVTSGTLNLAVNGTSSIQGTWMNNSALEFTAGTYSFSLAGASLAGSGTTFLAGAIWDIASPASVDTPIFQFPSGTIQGINNLTVNSSAFSWTGGSMQGSGTTIIPKGVTVTVSGAVSVSNRIITNSGTVNLTSRPTLTLASATWDNEGTFTFEDDGNIADGGFGPSTFNNDGTVQKTGGGIVLTSLNFNGTFNNNATGKVIATVGTLSLQSSMGTSAGAWTAAASGATVEFTAFTLSGANSSWTINAGTTMTGPGTITILAATWALTANLDVKSTVFSAGNTLPFFTVAKITGGFDLTLESPTINLVDLTLSGVAGPEGTLKIPNLNSVVLIGKAGSGGLSLSLCTFDNSGKATTVQGSVNLAAAVFLNEKGGQVILDVPPTFADAIIADALSTITNSGTIKLGTDGPANVIQTILSTGIFDNAGTISVVQGHTLDLSMGTGASTGKHTVAGTLTFQAGTYTLNTGTVLSGSGTINLGGIWQVASPATISSTTFQFGPAFGSQGIIQGSANLTISSKTVNCSGGTINIASPGVVTLSTGSVCNSDPSRGCTLAGSAINVLGKLSATNGNYSLGVTNLTIMPGGSLDLFDGFALLNGGAVSTVTNQGTVDKLTGTGTFTVNYIGSFINQGTVTDASGTINFDTAFPVPYIQNSGSTTVSNGATLFDNAFTVNGGNFGGIGNVFGTTMLTNAMLQAGSGASNGILNLNMPTTLNSGSTTSAVISGTTPSQGNAPGNFDQINSTSSMALAGTLNLSFGAGFSPTAGQSFNILNFASSSGSFSSVITPNPNCTANLTTTSTSLSVSFTSSGVTISINPTTVTLKLNAQQQFTDTVTNGCGNGVKWKVKEGAAGGTVTQTGLYTAPGTPGTFHVVATSAADPTKRATATVTVTTAGANKVAVTPAAAVVQPGSTLHLQTNSAVNWTVVEGVSGGNVSSAGNYTAATKPGVYHVLATSTADATNHAIVNIAVVGGKLKSAYVANLDTNSLSVLAGVKGSGPSTGQLNEMQSVSAGQAPAALSISPDGKYLLSANQNSDDLSLFTVSQTDGTLSVVSGPSIDTGGHPSAVAFDSTGRLAFVTNHDSDDISVFSVNAASGQMLLLGKQALATGDQPSAVAVHPAGSLVFVANSGSNTVAGFSYDAAGLLSPISGSPFATGSGPSAAVIDPAGKFLFLVNRGSGDVSVFAIDAKNKSLQETGGSPYPSSQGAAAVAIDVTGSYLFVAGHEANDVTVFQIDGEAGSLTQLGHTALSTTGPSSLAVDPSGQYLYVASDKTNAVTTLQLDVATGQVATTGKSAIKGKASSIVLAGSPASTPTR
jgi:6-phosphogluconolactonase (cycloisomerase 2 family)